ncbi:MAG: hypothetical protein NW226_00495 [Microscillaceae bacterium]|nr:hypothetical protein [Microscillaceae bacterium]
MKKICHSVLFSLLLLGQSCSINDDFGLEPNDNTLFNLSLDVLNFLAFPYADTFNPSLNQEGFSQAQMSRDLLAIFPGSELVDLDDTFHRSIEAWRFKLKLTDGARLIFYISKELGTIFRIDGTTPPYTYALNAGSDFISLNQAFQAALNVQGGSLRYWRLEIDNQSTWNFFIFIENQQGIWEIRVRAQDASISNTFLVNPPYPNDNDNSADDQVIPAEFLDRTQAMASGEIFHADIDQGLTWETYLETAAGGVLEARFSALNQALEELEGENGSFEYEVNPENGLLSFSTMRDTLSRSTQGSLESWKLEKDPIYANRWIYKFFVRLNNQSKRVYFDALTREIVLNEG